MFFGGLDIGTTYVKFSIYDETGNTIAYSQKRYEINRRESMNMIDPEMVWNATKAVIKETVALCSDSELDSLAVSSFGEAIVPINKDGECLHPAFLYTAPEGREEFDQLFSKIDIKRVHNDTGVFPEVMFPPIKINWYKNNTDIYDETWKFLLFEDYIIFKLTGETIISYSLASRTMAFDMKNGEWLGYVLDGAGISRDKLSTPAPSGTCAGKIVHEVAKELGINENTKVLTGGHDQMCSLLGGGASQAGSIVNSSGTVECMSFILPEALSYETVINNNIPVSTFVEKNKYFAFVSNAAGSALIEWLITLHGNGLKVTAKEAGASSIYDYLESGCNGRPSSVSILPFFAGRTNPFQDNNAKGSIHGLTLKTSIFDIYQAIMESICFEMRMGLECLTEKGLDIREMRAVGGGSKSDLWMQIKADIYKVPIYRLNTAQTGTLGCAMICAVSRGIYSSVFEAAEKWVKPEKVFYPRSETSNGFEAKYKNYKFLSHKYNG